MKIYTVHDGKAEAFLQPFYALTDGAAIRSFTDLLEQNDMFKKYPQDFTLFALGVYEETSGVITPCTPRSLGNGVEFVKPESKQK